MESRQSARLYEGKQRYMYIGPANHVHTGKIYSLEDIIVDYMIREVDAEHIWDKAETDSDGAILSAQQSVRVQLEHFAALPKTCFLNNPVDILLTILKESVKSPLLHGPCEPSIKAVAGCVSRLLTHA